MVRGVRGVVARNPAGWTFESGNTVATHSMSLTLMYLEDQLTTVKAAVLQRNRRATMTEMNEGGTIMGMLRVISSRGDDRQFWNEQEALGGDAEAMAALREAERIFAQERARGARAFRVEPGKPVERLEQFDAQAPQIVMVPRVVGG
jgi:hypothetical protein